MSKSIQGGSSIYNMAEGKGEKLIEGCFLRSKKVSNQLRQFDVTWGEFDRSTAVSPLQLPQPVPDQSSSKCYCGYKWSGENMGDGNFVSRTEYTKASMSSLCHEELIGGL